MKNDDQIRLIQFPDVNPATLPTNARFSMSAGDFLQVYDESSKMSTIETKIVRSICEHLDDWDCVATCFFIDTAHNIIEYVERLHKILKTGGVWINFGLLIE